MLDELVEMSQKFRPWEIPQPVIDARYSGALARINGRDVPDIAVLNLPDSNMGSRLVHQTNFEQTSLGWNRLFRRFWSIPDVKHRNMNSLTALFHGRGKQTMVVVGQVASRAQVWIFDLFDSA
jgi:hypothetical protein